MKILDKVEKVNELLSRKECLLNVEFEGATPTKEEVKEFICKSLKADEKLSVVRKVEAGFGSSVAKVDLYIYDDADSMVRLEEYTMHKKIRENLAKQEEARKKAEEEAAAAKKAAEEAKAAAEEASE
ncbi:hypothetical protein KY334_03165 [Candidatus Woesearchaeota archaeon]|nr:hypothetical protein [Candidatus Woesearchaeota archaeon]